MPTIASKKTSAVSKKAAAAKYSKDQYLEWYEVMLRIRKFEEASLKAYSQQKIRGFLHVYIGQEAIAAGIVSAISKDDKIVTGYRQHGIALCRGISSRACMAELFGKATGVVKGKGGSMHFSSAKHNYVGGNGIVGAQIPIGTGIALADQYKGTKNLCVTMFGDGAARQGALHESFNMAMTWKLPVLYICENNHYAMGTSVKRTSNIEDIYKLGLGYGMPSEAVDGMDPIDVHQALEKAAKHIRSGKGPYFLEIKTYRYRGHSVSDPGNYRTKDELNSYKEKDPIKLLENSILDQKIAGDKDLEKIKSKITAEIEDAVKFADESDLPLASELYDCNYIQEDYQYIMD